jgi:hypothetical protein
MCRFSVVSIQFSFMCSTWHIGLYAVATKPRPDVFCVARKLLLNSPSCCCAVSPESDCFQALEVYVTCWYVLFSLSIYYFVSCGTFVHVLALALSVCNQSIPEDWLSMSSQSARLLWGCNGWWRFLQLIVQEMSFIFFFCPVLSILFGRLLEHICVILLCYNVLKTRIWRWSVTVV